MYLEFRPSLTVFYVFATTYEKKVSGRDKGGQAACINYNLRGTDNENATI
jgi:hypothetical protein